MKLWFLILLVGGSPLYARTVSIIIHGTWGIESSWYLPGGDFFEAYHAATNPYTDHYCSAFSWSGKNSHEARLVAAQQLTYLISSYDPSTEFIIIAHSHGANVAFLASQILFQYGTHTIDTVFALGAPININWYAPNMQCIGQVVNLFSFRDLVQPVLGMFERQLPPYERVTNMRVLINDKQPPHSGLHTTTIARWLPELYTQFQQKKGAVSYETNPLVVKFSEDNPPVCQIDIHRSMLLKRRA